MPEMRSTREESGSFIKLLCYVTIYRKPLLKGEAQYSYLLALAGLDQLLLIMQKLFIYFLTKQATLMSLSTN